MPEALQRFTYPGVPHPPESGRGPVAGMGSARSKVDFHSAWPRSSALSVAHRARASARQEAQFVLSTPDAFLPTFDGSAGQTEAIQRRRGHYRSRWTSYSRMTALTPRPELGDRSEQYKYRSFITSTSSSSRKYNSRGRRSQHEQHHRLFRFGDFSSVQNALGKLRRPHRAECDALLNFNESKRPRNKAWKAESFSLRDGPARGLGFGAQAEWTTSKTRAV